MPITETESINNQIAKDAVITTGNYESVKFNALKHGILSRHTVLPHEDHREFTDLLAALAQEHQPAGPTEAHLVEELAGIMWRKRRVLMAEAAIINQGLRTAAGNSKGIIPSAAPFVTGLTGKNTDLQELLTLTPEEVAERQRETTHDLEATQEAAAILEQGSNNSYDKAMKALLPDSRDWWQDYVEEEEYPETAEGLIDFIRERLEPLCVSMKKEAQHHAAIKAQALGEGLKANRLEKLNRYETHLDRKFQRTLAMLVKLKELSGG